MLWSMGALPDASCCPLHSFNLTLCRLELRPVMYNEEVCQVSTLLTLLSGVLKPLTGADAAAGGGGAHASSAAGHSAALAPDHYERLFLYCATWSLGGLLEARDRPRFDAHLRAMTDQAPPKVGGQLNVGLWLRGPCCLVVSVATPCAPCS
jgi:hypothetical protein